MKKLVIASGNAGKLREITALLKPLDFEVHAQSEFNLADVPETGTTFVENAIIKARHAAQCCNMPALADDSGIVVDALNGAPGVYSARFAGEHGDDAANNALLVEQLREVAAAERTARYQALLVYMRHSEDPTPLICEGSWEGRIVLEPQGEGGFGYDPYFFVPTHNCTAAQLAAEEKNRISHRGQALQCLLRKVREINA